MNAATILAIIETVGTGIKLAVQFGSDVAPFVSILKDVFNKDKGEITEADLAAVEAKVDALSAELQAPLPPE